MSRSPRSRVDHSVYRSLRHLSGHFRLFAVLPHFGLKRRTQTQGRRGSVSRLRWVRPGLAVLLACIAMGWLFEREARMDSVETNIPTPGIPYAVAVNPVTNKIYVSASADDFNGVLVINGADNSTATVKTGVISPNSGIAVNPVTNKIYVGNGDNQVTVIDGADNTTQTVTVGFCPNAVAVNSVTNKIYVANSCSGSVTVIDGADNTTQTVTVGGTPDAVAVNAVTNKIYISNLTSANVTVINGADNTTQTVAVSSSQRDVAVNSVTNKIYVANNNGARVTVIDGTDNTTQTVTDSNNPAAVAVNPMTNKVYVANSDNNVTVIDGADNTTQTVTVGTAPAAVAVDPAINKIYVAKPDTNNVTVINGTDNTTGTLQAGTHPTKIGVNTVTNKIYVLNHSHTVTVIAGDSRPIPSTWQVSAGSTGACTLSDPNCASIQAAVNAAQSGNTINIAAGTYFEHDILVNQKSLTIVGADARTTIVDAQQKGRVFDLYSGADTLRGLTIKGGRINGPGGGIRSVFVQLVISDCNVVSNETTASGDVPLFGPHGQPGGGIYVDGDGLSTTIYNSTISNNRTGDGGDGTGGFFELGIPTVGGGGGNGGDGGGIFVQTPGTTIINSTISDNYTGNGGRGGNAVSAGNGGNGGSGGGIGGFKVGQNDVAINLVNCTVYNNRVGSAGGGGSGINGGHYGADGIGGGVSAFHPTIRNTIIAGNQGQSPDVDGSVNSLGHNMVENTTGSTGWTSTDIQNKNPLDPVGLLNHGGPTDTIAVKQGSLTIDGGDDCVLKTTADGGCVDVPLVTDQRGVPRKNAAHVDIGAVEMGMTLTVNTTADTNSGTCNSGGCSLREALNLAADFSGTDPSLPFSNFININIPTTDPGFASGVYTISLESPMVINMNVVINGPGANKLTIRRSSTATTDFSVFAVGHDFPGDVTLRGMTISGGTGTPLLGGGGIIHYQGTLRIDQCAISHNRVVAHLSYLGVNNQLPYYPSDGGGILSPTNVDPTIGFTGSLYRLIITNSTISDNSFDHPFQFGASGLAAVGQPAGSGISSKTNTTIIQSTISNNTGAAFAVTMDGGNVLNSTVTNSTGRGIAGIGTVKNSIVVGYIPPGCIDTFHAPFGGGTITRPCGNLSFLTQDLGNNITSGDPMLGPLQDNGGPTQTNALLPGSPALDAGDDCVLKTTADGGCFDDALATDQRGAGFTRKVGAHIDIGAFEQQPPAAVVFTTLANQAAEATGPSGAVVLFPTPTATDISGHPLTVTCDHFTGSTFPLGQTIVECSATDSDGHTGTASFSVTVQDTTPPELTLPGDISAIAPTSSGVAVQFSPAPSATDLVSGTVTVKCTPASGSIFAVGTTTVQCSATDAANNKAEGSFNVTVTLGNTSVGSNVTTQPVDPTTNSTPVTLTFQQVTAAGNTTVTSGPTNPSTQSLPSNFKLGSPATFFDISTTASFTPPVKVCVSYVGVAYKNESNIKLLHFNAATQHWDDITTPPVDTVNKLVCGSSPSLSPFVLAEADQPPVITVPTDKTVEATSANGAVVTYTATATDDFDSSVTVNCSPQSGSTFSLGTTTVQCSATDSAGNNAVQKSFKVKVQDTTAPVISLNSANLNPMTVEAKTIFTDPGATAVDAVSGTFAATASGTVNTNVVGTYIITYKAKDAANNAAIPVTRTVKVVDTTPPTISCLSPITVDATSPLGAVVTYKLPSASDTVSAVTVSCSKPSGSTFAVGTTTVQCTAKDASQNAASCSFNVTVLGSQGIEADVLNGLKTLRQAITDKEDGRKLDEAIKNLVNASDATLWIDPLHLVAKKGDIVFNETRDAIEKLRQLMKDKKSKLPDLQAFIDRLLQADRLIALAAINDALATHADAKKVAQATKEFSQGEAEASRGNYNPAIDHYREAWKQALIAMGKL